MPAEKRKRSTALEAAQAKVTKAQSAVLPPPPPPPTHPHTHTQTQLTLQHPLWQAYVAQQIKMEAALVQLQRDQEKENELQRTHEKEMASNCRMQ